MTSLGRLGAWAADHRRRLVIVWSIAVLALGALAPFAERSLSGAGWEAPGSESGQARRAIESSFPGQGSYALPVVVAGERATQLPGTVAAVQRVLEGDRAVRGVLAPQPGVSVSRDGRTAIVTGLAGAAPAEMVEAAGRLKQRLAGLSNGAVTVCLTGPAAVWSDFIHANKAAMMLTEWQRQQMISSRHDVDPLMTVMREGGGLYTRDQLPRYIEHLKATGRAHHAERLAKAHPDELKSAF